MTEKRPVGGARPGAGRPPGVPNKLPSKSNLAKEAFAERIAPHIEALADELLRIALTAEKDSDRLRAIETILTRLLGKPVEEVVLRNPGDAPSFTVADLLKHAA